MTNFSDKYNKTLELIDTVYSTEKELVKVDSKEYPKEYLYALRMVEELALFSPNATENHYLAARCQHFCRWEIPRSTYPMDRKGYHAWRTYLYTYQADKTEEILQKEAYSSDAIVSIRAMIEKKDLRSNIDSQLIEDVVCIVFLKYYVIDFVAKHKNDKDKLKRIILSTWLKMSDDAHNAALQINFDADIKALILEAVS